MKSKQHILIEGWLSNQDIFTICNTIIDPNYFDPEYRNAIAFIKDYHSRFNGIPDFEIIESETGVHFEPKKLTRDGSDYVVSEIETFCRQSALKIAVMKSARYIAENKESLIETDIRNALSITVQRDLGIDYFADPLARLEKQLENPIRTSTGWEKFDDVLGGGMARKEIVLFSANSGGGKSITLANLAVNFVETGYNVLYLSLELSEEMISMRFDTMISGIPTVAWRENYRTIAQRIGTTPHRGKLFIKHMPSGTNALAIRAYLKEFEIVNGFMPDLLVVDYLDIMGANERVSSDNVWEKDKRATEQLRDIGFEYNMYIASASQQNRSAIDASELNQSHIAGGLSKVNTVDVYASIIMTPAMRAAGEISFHMLKTRSSDGVGKRITLKWDNTSLRITNLIGDPVVPSDELPPSKQKPKRSLTTVISQNIGAK